ncbi:MAG: DUF916 domain-containing protein [Solirubrobacteraceae bacterium]|nr:DUF916 domain-containing protein [Solirubrobacteraceae bacterium]
MDLQSRQRAVGFAAALAVACTAASTAHAEGFADGFGARPIKRGGADVAASYFTLNAKPGQTLREAAVVSNTSDAPIQALVDGVDGLTGTTSGVVYANRDDRHLETSRWLRPSKRNLTIPPRSSARFTFEVRVPRDARPGDHLAGLAFQDVRQTVSGSRLSVRQVVRVVLGVQVTVGSGSPAQVDLGDLKIQALPGTQVPSVVLDLRNKGQLLCKPRARVVLTPPGGQPITAEQPLDTLLPGDEIAYPLPFKGALAAGEYRAEATIDGCGARQQANVTARLAASLSGTTPMADPPGTPEPGAPTSLALLGGVGFTGLLGGALLAAWMLRRRPSHESPDA